MRIAQTLTDSSYQMLRSFLLGAPRSVIHKAAMELAGTPSRDCETEWIIGAWAAEVGESDIALDELRRAVDKGYCAYPVIDTDPELAGVRDRPEFEHIRQAAMRCQKRFLEFRSQLARSNPLPDNSRKSE